MFTGGKGKSGGETEAANSDHCDANYEWRTTGPHYSVHRPWALQMNNMN